MLEVFKNWTEIFLHKGLNPGTKCFTKGSTTTHIFKAIFTELDHEMEED